MGLSHWTVIPAGCRSFCEKGSADWQTTILVFPPVIIYRPSICITMDSQQHQTQRQQQLLHSPSLSTCGSSGTKNVSKFTSQRKVALTDFIFSDCLCFLSFSVASMLLLDLTDWTLNNNCYVARVLNVILTERMKQQYCTEINTNVVGRIAKKTWSERFPSVKFPTNEWKDKQSKGKIPHFPFSDTPT